MNRQHIPVFRPDFGEDELNALREPFETGWIGMGPKTIAFEEQFAAYVGARCAVALNSATAALHLSLLACDIGPGDEVLVPGLSFVSTAHAVVYTGAAPVFVDVDPVTLNMNPDDARARITPRTRAVLPVHYGGHPVDLDAFQGMAREHDLRLIEDASHAAGASYKGRKIGSIGDLTCFSFHATKNLSTGDGGMITTGDPEIDALLRRLRYVGIDRSAWDRQQSSTMPGGDDRQGWYYEVHELGYKCNMNDIAAAIGLVQLARLDANNARRRELTQRYNAALAGLEWLTRRVLVGDVISAHHSYVIKTPYRDALNLHFKEYNIATGVHYLPIHLHPYYRERFPGVRLPVTESVWTQLLTLPLYPTLSDDDFDYIVGALYAFTPPT